MKTKYLLILMVFALVSNCMAAAPTWESLYKTRPDVKNCNAGALTATEKANLLEFTNYIRSLHKMQPLVYRTDGDEQAQNAALIMTANAFLDHTPASNVECFSQTGYDGAETSNLHLMTSWGESLGYSEDAVVGWLIDDKSASGDQLGHRRAVINPFVNGVAFGRVDGNPKVAGQENSFCTGMSMKYQGYYSGTAAGLEIDYVAYPYNDYPPVLFNKDFYLSFTAIVDKNSLWANQGVDFTSATVTMTTANGQTVAVSSLKYDNDGWGSLPNNLQWKAAGLLEKTRYNVEVKNVKYNGQTLNYSYWFNLQEPAQEELATPALLQPANAVTDLMPNVAFEWGAVTGAESYEFNLAESQEFTTLTSTQSPTNSIANVNNLESGKTYYWRVRAKKGSLVSTWSEVWSLTIKAGLEPTSIILLAPEDNKKNFDLLGDLTWRKVLDAGAYHLQVGLDQEFASENQLTVHKKPYTDTNFRFTTGLLLKNRTYFWRVRSIFPSEYGEWSAVRSFTTGSTTDVLDFTIANNISNVSIIPNPIVNDAFSVQFNSIVAKLVSIKIFNLLGGEVMNLNNYQTNIGANSISLNSNNMLNGAYWLVISDESGTIGSTQINVQR